MKGEERQNNMQGKQEAETYDKRRKDRKIKKLKEEQKRENYERKLEIHEDKT